MSKWGVRLGLAFVCCSIAGFCALAITFVVTKEKEETVNKQDADLIKLYHEQTGDERAESAATEESILQSEWKSGGSIDCILYLDSIGVALPVLKGNTEGNLSAFRTVVANNSMVLGETVYSIMGHHARDMNVSLGGLGSISVGDTIRIEKDGEFYVYCVQSSEAVYAEECNYLFRASAGKQVYLFTCDYTRGRDRLVYRVVTCVLS